jgi:Cupin-like domain/F-box-like
MVAQPHPRSNKRARRCSTSDVTSDDFRVLQAPHPYGVLPCGNRFLDPSSAIATDTLASSDPLSQNEECWLHILSYLDGSSLARMGQVSHFMYVAAHQPELWRDLVLKAQQKSTIHTVGPSWKDTYVLLGLHQKQSEGKSNVEYRPHQPMPVQGVYSDHFYRLHSCRSFAIPTAWMTGDNSDVASVPADEMSTDRFVQEFEQPNRPVLIRGAAKSWRAYTQWQDSSYLAEHTKQQTFRATSGVAPYPAQFTWSSYCKYCLGDKKSSPPHLLEEGPLYLFDRTALQPGSALWQDFMNDLPKICPYWDPETRPAGHDLFGLLGEGRRPDHTWLICGPQRSGSVFHLDPNGTHAWNAAIAGRKRWIFYPPGVTPPGIHPSDDGDEVTLPLSLGEWIFQFWDAHVERKHCGRPDERPLECTAMPGDVVFVPHGWWHLVVNLDAFNLAITHNYVSCSNLSNVLKFLDQKRDQVSGCRDREESIKPERLYEAFCEVLEREHPEWLEQALAEPEWTCRAWKNMESHKSSNGDKTIRSSVMKKAKSDGAPTQFSFAFV